jgi:hypothetical protein
MLKVAPKGLVAGAVELPQDEDAILRLAFGRYADTDSRTEAAHIVRKYQQAAAGHWFLCDCRNPLALDTKPPALIPVAETHIRRHNDARWPAHCVTCDFYRDAEEQLRITSSYRPLQADRPLQLIQGFRDEAEPLIRQTKGGSYERERPPLARLLVRLMTDAGLQTVASTDGGRDPRAEYNALRGAATAIMLTRKIVLKEYFETFPGNIARFIARVGAAPAAAFSPCRPHGVLLIVAKAIGAGVIVLRDDTKLPVRSRLMVFGEVEGHRRDLVETSRRPPYLVAGLVARPDVSGNPEILQAYAHPVMSARHLTMVDSDFERSTLDRLIGVQSWFTTKHGIFLIIEKPLADIGTEISPQDPKTPSRPPCIPDFIVRARSPTGETATVIVETMGFDDEAYRDRKHRLHTVMSDSLGGAPVIVHDFHFPRAMEQSERDTSMARAVIGRVFEQLRR